MFQYKNDGKQIIHNEKDLMREYLYLAHAHYGCFVNFKERGGGNS